MTLKGYTPYIHPLKWVPCYCGCGETAGHRGNLHCFIAKTREDGSVIWNDCGNRCVIYLEIAKESVKLYQNGKILKAIRAIIDSKYEGSYATPTRTNTLKMRRRLV